jgi:hypothetical protein
MESAAARMAPAPANTSARAPARGADHSEAAERPLAPHLHLVLTDGGFRRDGSFVTQFAHDTAVLAEAWRRTVLTLFVREAWLEE